MAYVQKNISDANMIHVNFNLSKFDDLKEYKALNEYIESSYIEDRENFVLIDEIQMCNNFELCINNLHATELYDIYITGQMPFCLVQIWQLCLREELLKSRYIRFLLLNMCSILD